MARHEGCDRWRAWVPPTGLVAPINYSAFICFNLAQRSGTRTESSAISGDTRICRSPRDSAFSPFKVTDNLPLGDHPAGRRQNPLILAPGPTPRGMGGTALPGFCPCADVRVKVDCRLGFLRQRSLVPTEQFLPGSLPRHYEESRNV